MKMSKFITGLILFGVLGSLFLYMAGFFTEKLPEKRIINVSDYPDMQTVVLKAQRVPQVRQFTGTVVADQEATLSARLTAKVAEVLVDVGDSVQQGDILMRLESADLDARVKQTEQGLSSAQAQLNAARKEYKRVKELVAKKLLPQSEFDRVESQLKTSQAGFKQAQAAVMEAETTFGFSIITAPFDGVVTRRPINKGDTATPGMQLLSLYNPMTLQIETNISEALIHKVALGAMLEFELPAYQIKHAGEVVEVSPAADNSSRSFMVKLDMNYGKLVYPGSYAKVSVISGEESVLTVPQAALYQIGQLDYVKVVENGVLSTRLVQLGADRRVRKGLQAGELVVLEPLNY